MVCACVCVCVCGRTDSSVHHTQATEGNDEMLCQMSAREPKKIARAESSITALQTVTVTFQTIINSVTFHTISAMFLCSKVCHFFLIFLCDDRVGVV